MRVALISSACALGIMSVAYGGCSKTHDRTVQSRTTYEPSAEQRRIDERREAERRAEDRKWEEQRTEERRLEDKRRADRRAEELRADEQRRAEQRAEKRPIGGGPNEPPLRATSSSAVANIAAARCDREIRCKNIGPKEKFHSRADCVADMQRDKRDDLNTDVCPGGVREKELNECILAIREEACGNPLDAISRLSTCRTGNLCVK
jgi:hypothetical protein